MVILVPQEMKSSRSVFFFEEKRVLEVVEAIEISKAAEFNEAA